MYKKALAFLLIASGTAFGAQISELEQAKITMNLLQNLFSSRTLYRKSGDWALKILKGASNKEHTSTWYPDANFIIKRNGDNVMVESTTIKKSFAGSISEESGKILNENLQTGEPKTSEDAFSKCTATVELVKGDYGNSLKTTTNCTTAMDIETFILAGALAHNLGK